jgi:DinB superfamily
MSDERDVDYRAENARELARMRAIVDRLSDEELQRPVNDSWTVAAVLGHIAFWDGRALALAEKLERGEPFSESDDEPEDVDWINDASRPLIHAIEPRPAAELALHVAEETDQRVAALSAELAARAWPLAEESPLNLIRASHRGEHLDEIEAALDEPSGGSALD